jgi:SM-20-related protein
MEIISQPANIQQVKVKILLNGGHKYTLYLNADSPILYSLMSTIESRSQKLEIASSSVFQIPIKEGRAALCFPSEELIGLVTEPPIFWQPNKEPQTQALTPLVSEFVQIDNFLTLEEKTRLVDYVLQNESAFVPTTTSTNEANYRRSMIMYSFPEFSQLITKRIKAILPDVFRKLKIEAFPISEIESQLTSHNNGNYYKIHNDNGHPDIATREFTYVYYFYQEPKAFLGGELLIYDSKIENNYYVNAETFHAVEPRNNSIVFFLSRYLHEVLPVSCPSEAFADSRFTINGWVRR